MRFHDTWTSCFLNSVYGTTEERVYISDQLYVIRAMFGLFIIQGLELSLDIVFVVHEL